MRLWDPRAAPGQACVGAVPLPGKVYAMSAGQERLVVGTSGRQVLVFDIRRWVWVTGVCSVCSYRCVWCGSRGRGMRLVVGTSGRQVLVFDVRRWVWVKGVLCVGAERQGQDGWWLAPRRGRCWCLAAGGGCGLRMWVV